MSLGLYRRNDLAEKVIKHIIENKDNNIIPTNITKDLPHNKRTSVYTVLNNLTDLNILSKHNRTYLGYFGKSNNSFKIYYRLNKEMLIKLFKLEIQNIQELIDFLKE